MKLNLPPALVTLIAGFLMWLLDSFIALEAVTFHVPKWIYRTVFGIAITIGTIGLLQFMGKKTTIDPHHPENAKVLITSGLYKFSRNPMYLALVFCLAAFALKLGNGLAFLAIPIFVMYMNRFQIEPEEEVLEAKFGDKFRQYKKEVRRWL